MHLWGLGCGAIARPARLGPPAPGPAPGLAAGPGPVGIPSDQPPDADPASLNFGLHDNNSCQAEAPGRSNDALVTPIFLLCDVIPTDCSAWEPIINTPRPG